MCLTVRVVQSLLPEKFHHVLCSYSSLDQTNLVDDDRTAQSGSDVGACERDIADFTGVGDSSYGLCLSTLESHGTAACEQPDVICQLEKTADVLQVSPDDLLHAVANSQVTAFKSDSRESLHAIAISGDSPITEASSPTHNICNVSPSFHMGPVGFKAKLRVNVETLAELEIWQTDFAERSKTTMRCANVSVCTGKKTLYKVNNVIFMLVLFWHACAIIYKCIAYWIERIAFL